MLFSIVAILFYTPTSSTHGIQFLHIFTDTCYFLICFIFNISHPNGCEVSSMYFDKCIQLGTTASVKMRNISVTP